MDEMHLIDFTHIPVCNECIASRLSSLWARLVENHVELFNLAAFLHNFQELKPIDPRIKKTNEKG